MNVGEIKKQTKKQEYMLVSYRAWNNTSSICRGHPEERCNTFQNRGRLIFVPILFANPQLWGGPAKAWVVIQMKNVAECHLSPM